MECDRGSASINPEFKSYTLEELDICSSVGIPVRDFHNWYRELHFTLEGTFEENSIRRRRKNPWIVRELRIAIITTKCGSKCSNHSS